MNPNRRYDPADEPLWLIIQREDQTRCFELPPNSHKAIVVGSAETADVRIGSIAPVAFFLERDEQSIWLTPAYPQAELRLDTTKVEGKRRIYTHGLVELGDVALRLKVRDAPPTLRSDSLMRLDAAVSAPVSNCDLAVTTMIDTSTVNASFRQIAMASTSPGFAIPSTALLTDTVEITRPDFDEWFEDAIAPMPGCVVDFPLLEPVETPQTPKNSAETTMAEAAVPSRTPSWSTPDTKTLEMPLFVWSEVSLEQDQDLQSNEYSTTSFSGMRVQTVEPPVASGAIGTAMPKASVDGMPHTDPIGQVLKPADTAATVVLTTKTLIVVDQSLHGTEQLIPETSGPHEIATAKNTGRLDPFRTIEIAAIRSSDLVPAHSKNHSRLEDLRQTVTIELGNVRKGGDTTDFEVPVVKHPAQALAVTDSVQTATVDSFKSPPACGQVAASPPNASLTSEPRGKNHGSAKPLTNSFDAANTARNFPSLMATLEKLGLLAMRRPWVVLTSAAAGSFLLMMLMIGVVRHLGHGEARPSRHVVTAQSAPLAANVQSANYNRAAPPVGSTQSQSVTLARSVVAPAALLLVPDTLPAIGHLFSGRLPEAEQAYRELATNFPDDLAFRAASKILGRRNSPTCRIPNSPSISCPSVKP